MITFSIQMLVQDKKGGNYENFLGDVYIATKGKSIRLNNTFNGVYYTENPEAKQPEKLAIYKNNHSVPEEIFLCPSNRSVIIWRPTSL